MKKYINIFLNSILAGFCITIGACVYLTLIPINKIVGSLLFGLGLFTIIHFNFWLYTGKVGATLDNKPKYLIDLLVCIIGNFIGVIILSALISVTRLGDSIIPQAINLVNVKQQDGPLSIFILSIMCGVMIYLAVKGHKTAEYPLAKALFCFLSISIFILCGFEHCIANACYYTLAGIINLDVIFYFLLMIIGNAIGSILFDGLIKLINKSN